MVEFALSIGVLVIVLVGLFDVGRIVFQHNALSQASREGARIASVQANWIGKTAADCTAPQCPSSASAFVANVRTHLNEHVSGIGTLTAAQVEVSCGTSPPPNNSSWSGNDCAALNTSGNLVTVRVEYLVTPLLSFLGPFQLAAQTTMVIN